MTGKETPMSDWECSAAVNIAGEHYECTEKSPHGHSSIHTNPTPAPAADIHPRGHR